MAIHFPFDNSYAALPERFFARLDPTPVAKPELIELNIKLARELGLDPDALATPAGVAILAGNQVPEGAAPLAQAYAGHQFAGWSPQLGDGRALLLGEVIDKHGQRQDIQLKGSGPTPFSRMGDGRAWLGPVLREYLVSEAMHALDIPTTRALAAVSTGQKVQRETALPGAIITRVASSHIRVGTFQYFAARQDVDALQTLMQHTIARHYPEAETPMDLLKATTSAQARLIAQWMSVGFIHGVMNTDNSHVGGLTIDYGPCAFLDTYDPAKVFSAIDAQGRYAYQNQPDIAVWNLAQFATSLLALMGPDQDAAIAEATEVIHGFAPQFRDHWLAIFGAKIGLTQTRENDGQLLADLLQIMAEQNADFTNSFRGLSDATARDQFTDPRAFDTWAESWASRLAEDGKTLADVSPGLARANPAIIPRNHQIEAAIQAAVAGDYTPFRRLSLALETPFADHQDLADLRRPPTRDQEVRRTFCGT